MYVIDAIGAVGADARGVVCGSMIILRMHVRMHVLMHVCY